MAKFMLRTSDTEWIARNHGTVDADGRVTVQVPDDQIEPVRFAGHDWVRHYFADVPGDALSPHIMCPAAWLAL